MARRDDPPPREIGLGASIVLSLDNPITRRATWPLAHYRPAGSRALYEIRATTFTAARMDEVMVNVDLRLGRVVSIAPQWAHNAPEIKRANRSKGKSVATKGGKE
jgi:hypothetical protein